MDPLALVGRLAAIERRGAGTDAERRAALALAAELRAAGRAPRVQALWVRPSWAPVHALIALLGVVGSALAVGHAVAGLACAVAALALLAGDLSGRLPLLRRLTVARATQVVHAPDPRPAAATAVRLVVTAQTDAPRVGPVERAIGRPAAWLRRRLGGHLPGLHGWLVVALLAVAACAAVRLAVDDAPAALGPIQLAPTVALLAIVGLLLDGATARAPRQGAGADASAAAVAVALASVLDARPPARLRVDVVLTGAGGPHALGMRRWLLAQRRRGVRAEGIAVLHVAACATGRPVWWTKDGLVLALRYHPSLVGHAAAVAADEPHLGARPTQGRGTSGARAARALGWPALAIGAADAAGAVPRRGADADDLDHVDDATLRATLELGLLVVRRLDAELAERAAAAPPRRTPVRRRLRREGAVG